LFLFTRAILAGQPIDVFNYGHHRRDFTYVDDIVEGVIRVLDQVATPNPAWSSEAPDPATSQRPTGCTTSAAPAGGTAALYRSAGRMPGSHGHQESAADATGRCAGYLRRCCDALIQDVGYQPATPIEEGVARFVAWYREYYRV
jgi:UDP-glucuronate 4-epimerase